MLRLVLVGSGLTHLLLMKKMQNHQFSNTQVILISPSRFQYYSGMYSGYFEGTYQLNEIRVDLEYLAKRAGITWLANKVVRLDAHRREVYTADGQVLSYDLCSVNIGSTTAHTQIPGVNEHAAMLKPSYDFDQAMLMLRQEKAIAIVGGGPSGVELALSWQAQRKQQGVNAPLYLIAKSGILPHLQVKHAQKVTKFIQKSGITLLSNEAVNRITDGKEDISKKQKEPSKRLILSSGRELEVGYVIWLAGSSAHPLFRESGFSVDEEGYVLTETSLQTQTDRRVFAVGDCRTVAEFPDLQRTGVFAVREFPILWSNLQQGLSTSHTYLEVQDSASHRFVPQKHYLSILNAGHHRAFLFYRGWMFVGWWGWFVKKWIDTQFMQKFRD